MRKIKVNQNFQEIYTDIFVFNNNADVKEYSSIFIEDT